MRQPVDPLHLIGGDVAGEGEECIAHDAAYGPPDAVLRPSGAVAIARRLGVTDFVERGRVEVAQPVLKVEEVANLPLVLQMRLARAKLNPPDLREPPVRGVHGWQPRLPEIFIPDFPPSGLLLLDHLQPLVIDDHLTARHSADRDAGHPPGGAGGEHPLAVITGALPTFGAECRFTRALQTRRRPVLKLGT